MTKENPKQIGTITRIYGENRKYLVARGVDAKGQGFSNRPLELDDKMQVIVKLDDNSVAKLQEKEEG